MKDGLLVRRQGESATKMNRCAAFGVWWPLFGCAAHASQPAGCSALGLYMALAVRRSALKDACWPTRAAQVPAPRDPGTVPDGGSEVVLERVPQKVEPPPLHRVLLLNDDYTPMEFVVMVLQEFFNKDRDTATQIMLRVHLHGKGVCGVYTADIAATKVDQVMKAASHAGHPLQCVSEPVD